jgi:hypothetical protein
MTDALLAVDRAIAGLCPCGAEPAPGSAYCGDDCTPTHLAVDTDQSRPGEHGAQSTPMRWRPDLVTEHDDSRLTLSTQFRRGRYNATVYEINGADGVHCRLDDGNRYVGVDADGYQFVSDEGLEPVWQRLERELGNSRHLDPDSDPWADVMPAFIRFNFDQNRAAFMYSWYVTPTIDPASILRNITLA